MNLCMACGWRGDWRDHKPVDCPRFRHWLDWTVEEFFRVTWFNLTHSHGEVRAWLRHWRAR